MGSLIMKAATANHALAELTRREDARQQLRAQGFALAQHDLVTRELRDMAAKDCLAASKEARDAGDHQGAVEWAEKMARQEFLASER